MQGPFAAILRGSLLLSWAAGCTSPTVWALPPAPDGARSYALEIDGPQRHLLLGDVADARRALTEPEGVPRAVAYYAQSFPQLATPGLLLPSVPGTCDRARSLPEQALASYLVGAMGDWQPARSSLLFGGFRLPPISLSECLTSGCLSQEGEVVICKSTCEAPAPPRPPAPAACALGWTPRTDGTAGCTGPDPDGCASAPCWLFAPGPQVECRPWPRPPEAVEHQGSALATVNGVVWLPRGRYQGPAILRPGAALYGECPEETVIVGGIQMNGTATVAALTVELSAEQTGVALWGRGNRVTAVRVIGGREGIGVAPQAEVELHSTRLDGPEKCVGVDDADVKLDHLWCSKPRAAGLVGGGNISVTDGVLESVVNLGGGWIVGSDSSTTLSGTFTGRRLLVDGPNDVAVRMAQAYDLSDLRIAGGGAIGTGVLLDGRASVGQVQQVEINAVEGPAVWVRNHATARISDLSAVGAEMGLALTASVTVRRVYIEGAKVEGLEGSDNLDLDVLDLKIVGGAEGMRIAPDPPSTHVVKIRRVLIEGAAIGLARSGGPVRMEEVVVRGCRQGIRTSACLVDEVLIGVRLEDVVDDVLYDDP